MTVATTGDAVAVSSSEFAVCRLPFQNAGRSAELGSNADIAAPQKQTKRHMPQLRGSAIVLPPPRMLSCEVDAF
jgi:hypothetical protein